jgi:hypothetical protein
MTTQSPQLDALTKEVANSTQVEQSAVTLIHNIAAQLSAAGTDGAALQQLHDTLVNSDKALAAAITANTVAAPGAAAKAAAPAAPAKPAAAPPAKPAAAVPPKK